MRTLLRVHWEGGTWDAPELPADCFYEMQAEECGALVIYVSNRHTTSGAFGFAPGRWTHWEKVSVEQG
jgi:hypothetical protein